MGVLHPMQQTVARVATRVWGNFRAERIEGRRFLVEAVTYTEVARELEALPASGISTELASADTPLAEKLQIGRQFPPAPPRSRSIDRIELASTLNSQRGLTLDWVLLNSTANLVLKGDTTYRVRSLANLTGVTKLEGGAVLKFDVGAQVRIAGTLECQTSPMTSRFSRPSMTTR